MSTEQNKAIVRRFVEEGINPANMAVFDELLAEDVLDHDAPPGTPPGREGWKLNRRVFKAAFPDGRWEIADMVAEGDLVVVRAPFSGTHQGEFFGARSSGRRVSIGSIHICRVVYGRVVEHWGNSDDMALMQQIGAMPVPEAAGAAPH
jgi:predicted ester cyclase